MILPIMGSRSSMVVATALIGMVSGQPLWPHDWPQFGKGPDFHSFNDIKTSPKHKEWVWQSADKLVASPAVAAGRIFLGSDDGYMYCLNQTTGTELWKFKTMERGKQGVRSSPAVHADLSVSFGSYDGHVYHINGETGQLIWKYDTGSQIYSPVSVDSNGTVYAGNYGPKNCLYALHSMTQPGGNQLKWKACGKIMGAMNSGAAFSPGGSTLVMNNFDGVIRGIDIATGDISWTFATDEASGSSAAVVGDTAYIGSWSKFLYALDVNTGVLRWKFNTDGEIESHPSYHSGIVYVTSEESQAIFALNATSGEVIWKRVGIAKQEVNGSPSITPDYVFFGANDGVMYALDPLSGTTKFEFNACDGHIFTSAAVADNGMIYFTCGDDSETPSVAPNKAFALDPQLHAV